ncbi:MAG: SGNH/GDSL hydrolase family protein [Clostridia bacterium]|nr:SGNH/GDSL hydrolase family protein [Clostridia bacterium]
MLKLSRMLLLLGTLLLAGAVAVSFAACVKTPTVETSDETTPEVDETTATPETTEEETTEEETTEEATTEEETTTTPVDEQIGLDVQAEDLNEIMQNVFGGTTSIKETVMFIDKGDVKSLLFPIESMISVTSYNGNITYEEGRDYVIVDGKLQVTEDSRIPCITSAVYYNYDGSLIHKDGKPLFWGESRMKNWQVAVTYTHEDNWEGYLQESQLEVYKDFVKKLVDGEDVTVLFYGDSITYGANSSYNDNVAPKQGAYPMLFVQTLADLFGYTVKYVNTGLVASMPCHPVPTSDYVAGERGTITYINTAIGGWTSQNGVDNFDKFVGDQVEKYGCDLLVLAFGMNDGQVSAGVTKSNDKKIIDSLYALNPNAAVMIVSTMTPHSGSDWDSNNTKGQERQLLVLANNYRKDGKAVAVACMNSVSKEVQKHKTFNDYAGNNINHPNDWFYRVYAQTLLQTLIGYEYIQ